MAYTKTAQKGCMWVLTGKGYEATPDTVKHEREVGKPIPHFKESVPTSWIEKGCVVKVKFRGVNKRYNPHFI